MIIVCLFAISTVSAEEMDNNTDIIAKDFDSDLIAESSNDIIAFENTNDSSEDDLLSSGESISAPDVVKYYGGSERFSVKLYDSRGYGISYADVKITINGNTYTRTTDYNGYASIALGLNSGVYDVTTSYGSKRVYSTVTIKDTVISKDFTKMFRNQEQYTATLLDSNGNRLSYYTPVKININGVYYTRYTDSNGVVTMNINLNPGTYDLTATNPSTGEMHTTKIRVRSTITNNYDLTKYYKSDSQYSIKILDHNGNAAGSGIGVTFNINGVFYTRYSNENGNVKMNINLNPGEYIITADYNGLKASNNIKVLPTISAKDLTMKYKDGSQFEAKVLNGNGQPYANQKVSFNVNGVFYQRTTDSSGIARLTINLEPGTYTITSTYNGLNAANTVVVKSNSNNGGNTYSKDSGYVYINLPSYDTKISQKVGIYTISVEQWRSPSLGEVDILVYDPSGNIVDRYVVESKISDGSVWSGTYGGYYKAVYHKWQFDPNVRITQVAVQLLGRHWDGS